MLVTPKIEIGGVLFWFGLATICAIEYKQYPTTKQKIQRKKIQQNWIKNNYFQIHINKLYTNRLYGNQAIDI